MVHERMLFTLAHVPFSEVLPAWLAVNERLGPVPAMLFGLRYISHSYVENRGVHHGLGLSAANERELPGAVDCNEDHRTVDGHGLPSQTG
jgi:hypothetical protein